MRRALFAAAGATLVFACSFTSLDGFATGSPDGAAPPAGDATTPEADAAKDVTTVSPAETGGPRLDPYGDAVRDDTPATWLRFEELSGAQTAKDETGAHPATLAGGVVTFGIDGAVGKCARFSASGEGLTLGDVFDFSGKVDFSLEVWGENDAQTNDYEAFLSKRVDGAQGAQAGWLIYREKSTRSVNFQFWKNGSQNSSVGTDAIKNGFHHHVVTATRIDDGVDLAMYLDGELVSGGSKGTTAVQPNTPELLRIGRAWAGRIDEVAIYEHSLTPDRVRAHHRAAPPR